MESPGRFGEKGARSGGAGHQMVFQGVPAAGVEREGDREANGGGPLRSGQQLASNTWPNGVIIKVEITKNKKPQTAATTTKNPN